VRCVKEEDSFPFGVDIISAGFQSCAGRLAAASERIGHLEVSPLEVQNIHCSFTTPALVFVCNFLSFWPSERP
jgi:hypothetical protein